MFIWPSKEKDSNTCAFSRAEAWQRSTAKMLCKWNHLRQYAQARFSTALRNMCTCTSVGCTHFFIWLVYWYRLQSICFNQIISVHW